jgi:hypothetical protein
MVEVTCFESGLSLQLRFNHIVSAPRFWKAEQEASTDPCAVSIFGGIDDGLGFLNYVLQINALPAIQLIDALSISENLGSFIR